MAMAVHYRGRAICSRRLMALRHLTDNPREAAWREPDERIAFQARIAHERKSREAIRHYKVEKLSQIPAFLALAWPYDGGVRGNDCATEM
jgi:hypothetical protein